ncbi:hypothetical protein AFERRI_30334 [Acidithiobacillus ferrivorans]|uniref:Uncharacterized protein n=1 Tax=Acidithiobacillus ferrivorans TaxID=160808 RepID=A0A060USB3_9PROT|nr:hypothetical protein AFERRI_30334 [Acidithiobacillus ferrivorans]
MQIFRQAELWNDFRVATALAKVVAIVFGYHPVTDLHGLIVATWLDIVLWRNTCGFPRTIHLPEKGGHKLLFGNKTQIGVTVLTNCTLKKNHIGTVGTGKCFHRHLLQVSTGSDTGHIRTGYCYMTGAIPEVPFTNNIAEQARRMILRRSNGYNLFNAIKR